MFIVNIYCVPFNRLFSHLPNTQLCSAYGFYKCVSLTSVHYIKYTEKKIEEEKIPFGKRILETRKTTYQPMIKFLSKPFIKMIG